MLDYCTSSYIYCLILTDEVVFTTIPGYMDASVASLAIGGTLSQLTGLLDDIVRFNGRETQYFLFRSFVTCFSLKV